MTVSKYGPIKADVNRSDRGRAGDLLNIRAFEPHKRSCATELQLLMADNSTLGLVQ
jgi:hypothetical protein